MLHLQRRVTNAPKEAIISKNFAESSPPQAEGRHICMYTVVTIVETHILIYSQADYKRDS